MTSQLNESFLKMSLSARSEAGEKAKSFSRRWHRLCERYLPVKADNSIWRYSRESQKSRPSQGWKLHISATVFDACDLFEKVAPFLTSQKVQFKAPESLDELSKINCGLQYGYAQVGKFITVYPVSEKQAVRLARRLHKLTREFVSISVPFDEQYLPNSSVFYRYGGFAEILMKDDRGRLFFAVKNSAGEFVPDDRLQAVPEWLSDPFQNNKKKAKNNSADTPLTNTYKVFRALTQRGKGGTYQALDFSHGSPRLCVIKEGRKYGEVGWNGQDGYHLVKNELEALDSLRRMCLDVPQVISSFELNGNFYLVMEYVAGKSLHSLMKPRRRRYSIKQVVEFAVQIARIIREINQAGWIWNDCKPANLIVTPNKKLKPIDFENAYPVNQSALFDWTTQGFSRAASGQFLIGQKEKSEDIYALGAVIYFLLTGKLYNAETPVELAKLRRNVPPKLREVTEKLLSGNCVLEIAEVEKEFREIQELF